MDLHRLNDYSRKFADAFLRRFPALAPHSRVGIDEDGTTGVMVVELQPFPRRAGAGFSVSTHGSEVTVGFDEWHGHFDWPSEDVLSFIDDLFAGRQVVEVWTRAGEYTGSSVVRIADMLVDASSLTGDQAVFYRSWDGASDRILKHESAG